MKKKKGNKNRLPEKIQSRGLEANSGRIMNFCPYELLQFTPYKDLKLGEVLISEIKEGEVFVFTQKNVTHYFSKDQVDFFIKLGSLTPQEIKEPSKNILFLAGLLYPARNREASLGDLEEKYRNNYKKFGRRKAHIYLVRDSLESIYPITKAVIVRLFKILTFYAILKKLIS